MNKTAKSTRHFHIRRCISLSVCILSFFCNLMATDYYVSTLGNDGNSGTSENGAWRHINYAASIAKAGDVVHILSGVYNEMVTINNSGEAGKLLVFRGEGTTRPIIDGAGIITPPSAPGGVDFGLLKVTKVSYIVIENLEIRNAYDYGVTVNGPNVSNVTLRNLRTYRTIASGIYCNGESGANYTLTNLTIEDCEVEQSHYITTAENDYRGYQESLSVAGGCSNVIIRNNHVHHSGPGKLRGGPIGIDAKDGVKDVFIYNNLVHDITNASGIYTDAWTHENSNINIYNNIIFNTLDDGISIGAEQGGTTRNVNVFNNLIYNTQSNGISINHSNSSTPNDIHDINIYNNTVYGSAQYACHITNGTFWGVHVKNNIFSQNGWSNSVTLYSSNASNADVANNISHGAQNAWINGMSCVLGSGAISSDPLFEWAANGNFRLTSASPAINAATTALAATSDLDDNPRPAGGNYDIGCYEFGATPLVNILQNSGFESDFNNWGSDWGYSSIVNSPIFLGVKSLKIAPSTSGGGRAQVLTTSSFSVGSQYTISAYAMMSAIGGPAGTTIGVVCKNSAGERTGTFVSPDISNTGSYLQTSKSFTVPTATTTMEVNVWYPPTNSSVSVYLDNFALVAGSTALKISKIPVNALVDNSSIVPELQVFPNPLNGRNLHVNTMGMVGDKTFTILDLAGNMIYKSVLSATNNNIIELNNLNIKGLYIVKVSSDNGTRSQKIVVN